jgi:hypothetical protein
VSVNTLHGRGGLVFLAPSYVSDAVPLGQARSWRFVIDQDLIENTQGFGAVWKTFLLAGTGWTASIEGNLDTHQTTPFDAASQPTAGVGPGAYGAVAMYFYPDRGDVTHFYAGTGWPKLTVSARLTEVIRFTLDLTGDGPFVQA